MKSFVFSVIAVFLFFTTEAAHIGNQGESSGTKNPLQNIGNVKAVNKVISNIEKNLLGKVGVTENGMVVVEMSDEAVYVGNGDVGLIGKGQIGKNFVGEVLGLGNCVTDKCGVIKTVGNINLSVGPLGQKIVGFVNGDNGKVGVVTCLETAVCAVHTVDDKIDDIDVKNVFLNKKF